MLASVSSSRSLPVLVALTLLLAACSGSSDTATSPTPVEPSEPTATAPTSPPPNLVNDCVIEPEARCPGATLTMVSLAGEDLSGANLEGANLHASDLREVDLTGANLTDTDIGDSDLTEAKLVGADLTGAKLKDANLSRTDFTGATVSNGQLMAAYLCGTIMPNGSKNNSGCKVPTDTPSASTSASPGAGGPTITSFLPPDGSPPCPSSPPDAQVTVKIRYKVTGANEVDFLIDSVSTGDYYKPTGGTAELDFTCDKPSHRFTIIATGDGKKTKQVATVYRT